MSWEQQMAERTAARYWEAELAEARAILPASAFSPDPPDDGTCLDCHEWQVSVRELGTFMWFGFCGYLECPCGCHPQPLEERMLFGHALMQEHDR